MNIDLMQFVYNLKYMAVGMGGIMVVIGAIMLSVYILGKVTEKSE